jgi:hypothetical protein
MKLEYVLNPNLTPHNYGTMTLNNQRLQMIRSEVMIYHHTNFGCNRVSFVHTKWGQEGVSPHVKSRYLFIPFPYMFKTINVIYKATT